MRDPHLFSADDRTIKRLLQSPETTMDRIVSNSAGMAFLMLRNQFQRQCILQTMLKEGKTEAQATAAFTDPRLLEMKLQQAYEHCQTLLRTLPVNEHIQADIDYLLQQAAEPPTVLDQLTLTQPSHTGVLTEQKMTIPLKQVIVLVWQQLNENIHTEQDRTLIMHSFFNALSRIHQGICHTGTRHELMFLLNGMPILLPDGSKTYLTILEDAEATTLAVIREALQKRLIETYARSAPEQKQVLYDSFIRSLTTGHMQTLVDPLEQLTPTQKKFSDYCIETLSQLFLTHGSHPHTLTLHSQPLSDAIHTLLRTVTPTCDATIFPSLALAYSLLSETENDKNCHRLWQSIKSWINEHRLLDIQPDSEVHQIIEECALVYAVYKHFKKDHLLLMATHTIDPKESQVDNAFFIDYFNTFPHLEPLTPERIKWLENIKQRCLSLESDAMQPVVETFFNRWFQGVMADDLIQKREQYYWLLDITFQTLIKHNATALTNSLIAQKEPALTVTTLPFYLINCLLLAAIITPTSEWHHTLHPQFSEVFEKIITALRTVIPRTPNDDSPYVCYTLLINQCEYLIKQQAYQNDRGPKPPRPPAEEMLLLPQDIKNAEEWMIIADWLTEADKEKIFQAQRALLYPYFLTYMQDDIHQTPNMACMLLVLCAIPESYREQYITTQLFDQYKNAFTESYAVYNFLSLLPAEAWSSFCTWLGPNRFDTLLFNPTETVSNNLKNFLKFLQRQTLDNQFIGLSTPIIQSALIQYLRDQRSFELFFTLSPPKQRVIFLKTLSTDILKTIVQQDLALEKLLLLLSPRNQKILLEKLHTILPTLITDATALAQLCTTLLNADKNNPALLSEDSKASLTLVFEQMDQKKIGDDPEKIRLFNLCENTTRAGLKEDFHAILHQKLGLDREACLQSKPNT